MAVTLILKVLQQRVDDQHEPSIVLQRQHGTQSSHEYNANTNTNTNNNNDNNNAVVHSTTFGMHGHNSRALMQLSRSFHRRNSCRTSTFTCSKMNSTRSTCCSTGRNRTRAFHNDATFTEQQQQYKTTYRKRCSSRRSTGTTVHTFIQRMILCTFLFQLAMTMNPYQYKVNIAINLYNEIYNSHIVTATATTTTTTTTNNKKNSAVVRSLSKGQRTVKIPKLEDRDLQSQDQRTILVIRILDTTEDDTTRIEKHNSLRSVLFDGGPTSTTGQSEITPSVQEQMSSCSGNAILFVPLTIPNNGDNDFIVDVVVNSNQLTDPFNPNEWVEVMGETVSKEGPLSSMMAVDSVPSQTTNDFYTVLLRQLADHVLIILPESFPNTDFLATGEIDNTITIYAIQWATSLSTYMHELAHNLGLRHSGDTAATVHTTSDTAAEYGDSSGYMGQSFITPWTPQKCYNAAQHWQLGWYTKNRVSFSDTADDGILASLPLRVNVAAFVDYTALVDQSNNQDSYVILVQITSNVYLQFNCAKSFNIGTDVIYANEVVIIEQLDDLTTRVLASLQSQESYTVLTDSGNDVIIYVCDIIMTTDTVNTDFIDHVILAISDRHTSNDITSVCQNGPEYSAPTTTLPPTANTQVTPSSSDTNVPSPSPSNIPVVTEVPITTSPPSLSTDDDNAPAVDVPVTESKPDVLPTNAPLKDSNNDNNNTEDKDEDEFNNEMPVQAPVVPVTSFPTAANLRGGSPVLGSESKNPSTAIIDKSASSSGFSTSSVIYTVFGSIVGGVLLSMLILFYLSKQQSNKPVEGRVSSSPTSLHQHRRSTSSRSDSTNKSRSRSKQHQLRNSISDSQTDIDASPDSSPTYQRDSTTRSKHCYDKNNDQQYDATRSKRSLGSSTSIPTNPTTTGTKSSSQHRGCGELKEKVPFGGQQQVNEAPLVAHNSSPKRANRSKTQNRITQNNVDNDSSDDDDDRSDTLSVILQQEIWKERVHKILKNVLFVQDKDGTTQMLATSSSRGTTKR